MKWLVTAFEPFGGDSTNSSLEVLKALEKLEWQGSVTFHSPVPVVFATAWSDVRSALENQPDRDGVLCLGQAGNRARIALERMALNWVDGTQPDNAGLNKPTGKICAGEGSLWSSIPWTQFSARRPDLFDVSFSAGAYVCNHLMFESLQWAKDRGKMAGFIHIPRLSDTKEAGRSSMPAADAVEGVRDALDFLVQL